MAPTTRAAASAMLFNAWQALEAGDHATLRVTLPKLTATNLQEQFQLTEKGDTLLTGACRRGDDEAVALLLKQGTTVDSAPNGIGANALHIACNLGHTACTALLIDSQADVNSAWAEGSGCRPLHFAARQGSTECLRLLLAHPHLDVDALTHRGLTALHMASNKGFDACVVSLIEAGAAIDLEGPGGMGALHCCANKGHTACVRALLEAGASVDALCHGSPVVRTPLHLACERGYLGVCQMLSAYSARRDFAHEQLFPSTAEFVAARAGHTTIVRWLRATKHWTPLHHLEQMSEARCTALLRGDSCALARPCQGVGADPHQCAGFARVLARATSHPDHGSAAVASALAIGSALSEAAAVAAAAVAAAAVAAAAVEGGGGGGGGGAGGGGGGGGGGGEEIRGKGEE